MTRQRTANDGEAASVLARYERMAPLYDALEAVAEGVVLTRWRKLLWRRVGTNVDDLLELDVGTGKNLRFHPPRAHVIGIDLSPSMLDRARRRAARLGSAVDLRVMDVEHLELPSGAFDAVTATFLFCSVADPIRGLQKARRVLRPGGVPVLLEHVRPVARWLGRVFDLIDPLAALLSGAHLNRRTPDNVRAAGLRIAEVVPLAPSRLVQLIVARPP